ncbi:GTP-dependent dephospho-CoA kinase family protein [Halorientalis marina]|uniref:GTP-dependent dephospho-CoA kinase family protein n=1 Tax=Halorientalis marina TaxID=2931976 RepID=UPI001FF397CA|nr:GTP-dependent dephospho-CoA kinase family protein [Halorientalis marina]
MGPIYTDAEALLADAGTPIVAVGDIVTYHLTTADHTPAVALVDGRTKRAAVEDHIEDAIDGDRFDNEIEVANPPATLSAALLSGLHEGLSNAAAGETTVVVVDGEEDLAALPAIATAPEGGSVVYGQPDEGMVLVDAGGEARATVTDLLERMDGDTERLWTLLGR